MYVCNVSMILLISYSMLTNCVCNLCHLQRTCICVTYLHKLVLSKCPICILIKCVVFISKIIICVMLIVHTFYGNILFPPNHLYIFGDIRGMTVMI